MRILIADDDPQFLRALRITLGARGYEVLLARDGQHALEMAIDHKPDIICLLYTSPSPRDKRQSRMPSSA